MQGVAASALFIPVFFLHIAADDLFKSSMLYKPCRSWCRPGLGSSWKWWWLGKVQLISGHGEGLWFPWEVRFKEKINSKKINKTTCLVCWRNPALECTVYTLSCLGKHLSSSRGSQQELCCWLPQDLPSPSHVIEEMLWYVTFVAFVTTAK